MSNPKSSPKLLGKVIVWAAAGFYKICFAYLNVNRRRADPCPMFLDLCPITTHKKRLLRAFV
jgi:hypothetical protein